MKFRWYCRCIVLFHSLNGMQMAAASNASSTGAAITVALDGSCSQEDARYSRRRRAATAPRSSPSYYDNLRIDLATIDIDDADVSISTAPNSSIYEVTLDQTKTTTYRLAEIKAFTAYSNGTSADRYYRNEAFALLLAAYHFNNMQELGHPVLGELMQLDPVLQTCNVKITMELFDSQLSPTQTTQLFSSVLRRPVTIRSPSTTAVVGATRSSETLPLAILTGIHTIPHLSASATSSSFDDKAQFPYFGRTVTSTKGEAAAAVKFFQSIGATHVAILFLTDAYGSALQKSFRDESEKVNLVTESVPYAASATRDDLVSAMASLKRLQFHYVYAICFIEQVEDIMSAAAETGAVGPDYLYVFPGVEVLALLDKLRIEAGSPLAQAFNGTALIHMQSGTTKDHVVQGEAPTATFDETSTLGYDRFQVAWRDALQDSAFVKYVQSKFPFSLIVVSDFNRSADFFEVPYDFVNFNYDAVTALGLAMCRAGENATFFTGEEIYTQYLQVNFEGSSGQVRVLPASGTRDYTTITFIVWNIRITGMDSGGYSIIEYVPSFRFENDIWSEIQGNDFVYADGTTMAPPSLPAVPFNFNYIGTANRAIGCTLMGLVMVAAVACLGWTLIHRTNHVVDSAQPIFLIVVCIGAVVMVSTIIPLGLEETVVDDLRGLDTACMAVPWLYFLGTSIACSGLLAKTHAVHQAYMNPDVEEIHVTSTDILKYCAVLVTCNLVVLISWSVASPLRWLRVPKDNTDSFGRLVESTTSCTSDKSLGFAAALLGVNFTYLAVGTLWAYRSRNISTEFNESHYIGLSIAAMLQSWSMAIPVLIVVKDSPVASFFIKCGLIVLTSGLVLALVFVPKIHSLHFVQHELKTPDVSERTFARNPNHLSGSPIDEKLDDEKPANDSASRENSLHSLSLEQANARSRRMQRRGSIKVTHNPRSAHNLMLSGGLELSQRQLEMVPEGSVNSLNNSAPIDPLECDQVNEQSESNVEDSPGEDAEVLLGKVWTLDEQGADQS